MGPFGAEHEALVRQMLTPELPRGWRFANARIDGPQVIAQYTHASARAEVVIARPEASTERLKLAMRATRGAPLVEELFRRVGRAVRALEHELRSCDEEQAVLDRLTALEQVGRCHEALEIARAHDGARVALARARLRASYHDDANAAEDARVVLASSRGDRAAAMQILAAAGHLDEALALARAIEPASVRECTMTAAIHRAGDEHERANALYRRAGDVEALAAYGAWSGDPGEARRSADPMLQGIAHALEGEHGRALVELERAVSARPRDATCALWRAETMMHLGDLDAARVEAARARELTEDGTNHVPALLLRAEILRRLGVSEPVEPVLAEAMRTLSPNDPRDWAAALASLRGNRGVPTTYVDPAGALRTLVLKPAPRTAAKYALLRFVVTADTDEAERDFDRVQAEYPDVPEIHNYRGELWLYVGDYARARRCFERALSMYEESRWAFIGLAAVELLEGDPRAALATLSRQRGEPGPTAFVYRGEARRRLGDRAGARADLEHSVALHPARIGAWVNLGLLQRDEGDADGLARTIEGLRTRAPGLFADAAGDLGEMLVMLRGNRASTCVTYFTREGALRTVPPFRSSP